MGRGLKGKATKNKLGRSKRTRAHPQAAVRSSPPLGGAALGGLPALQDLHLTRRANGADGCVMCLIKYVVFFWGGANPVGAKHCWSKEPL